jgi:hypothetical protein
LTLRKGLVLFLLLSFGVSAVVLLSSVDSDTWTTILRAEQAAHVACPRLCPLGVGL